MADGPHEQALGPLREDEDEPPGRRFLTDIDRILRETRTVAIVGASANRARAVYGVWRYLESASDYTLYLVNPTITDVEGTPAYPDLASLPVVPDLVDVFRRHEHLPAILDEAIAVGAKTLWLQSGLSDEKVARDGEAAGLAVVMDRCLKVEYAAHARSNKA